MFSRDANNATWYLLRYATDFAPRVGSRGGAVPTIPALSASLFYDDARHVLELLPAAAAEERAPLPALAVDVTGEMYRANSEGRLVVVRCDGSEKIIVCGTDVLGVPGGLALDRRGLLYVADPAAGRVLVLHPDDGAVEAILEHGLKEPVDVAVSPAGKVYVADRAGGIVAVFTARFTPAGSFAAQTAEPLPKVPRPIAVMIDGDGTVLVADANHPRVLRFSPDGAPLGDVRAESLTRSLREIPESGPRQAYGLRPPLFLPGLCAGSSSPACFPPVPEQEAGVRLAAVHRDLRLLRLQLNRRFEPSGVFYSAWLDGATPGTTWHRVQVKADLPPGTRLTVQTVTAEKNTPPLDPEDAEWEVPKQDDRVLPITSEDNGQLIQSPPGRYLRLRVELQSLTGEATASVQWIKVSYPRFSYLELLPRIYRRDPSSALFLERFLALFEQVLTGVEDRYEEFSRQLNPDAAPRELIDWLACLIDLTFDPSWSLEQRRALVGRAMELYRRRGTVRGIELYVETYTGVRPVVSEAFLQRPRQPAWLGRRGTFLGGALLAGGGMAPSSAQAAPGPAEALFRRFAHRFTVTIFPTDPCESEALLAVVDRIVEVNKPAHTEHEVRAVYPEARVDEQSVVGVDLVLGGRAATGTRLGGCPAPGRVASPPPGVLGRDAVLRRDGPPCLRPVEPAL